MEKIPFSEKTKAKQFPDQPMLKELQQVLLQKPSVETEGKKQIETQILTVDGVEYTRKYRYRKPFSLFIKRGLRGFWEDGVLGPSAQTEVNYAFTLTTGMEKEKF